MEYWLNAFARGLRIDEETDEGLNSYPASEEQKQAFFEALKADLKAQGKHKYISDTVTYDYRMGMIRGRALYHEPAHVFSANAAFQNVLRKLPKLPKGMTYTLPVPTHITFRVVNKCEDDTIYDVVDVCSWIMQNL